MPLIRFLTVVVDAADYGHVAVLLDSVRCVSPGSRPSSRTMDTDSAPELDFSKADREVYLVQIPPHLAAQWAECDFDDELGTIVFPTDTSKVRNSPSLNSISFHHTKMLIKIVVILLLYGSLRTFSFMVIIPSRT